MSLKLTFDIICPICANKKEWYYMPKEEKVLDGLKYSDCKYILSCKNCKCTMELGLTVKVTDGGKNGNGK